MSIDRDSILFYAAAELGAKSPTHGLPDFIRTTGAWYFDGALFRPVPSNTLRKEPVTLHTGERVPAWLAEPATEQEFDAPFDFSSAAWTKVLVTRTDAESIFRGETASRVTGAGGVAQVHQTKTLTGASETLVQVLEQGSSGSAFIVAMYDQTAGVYITRYQVSWDTLSTTLLSGTAAEQIEVRERRRAGPNGGKVVMVRLTDTGTAGNVVRGYHVGVNSTDNPVLHYIGWEPNAYGSNPLDGPANTAQTVDSLSWPAPPPQRMALYSRWVCGMPGTGGVTSHRIWHIGSAAGPYLILYVPAGNQLRVQHYNGTTTATDWVNAAAVFEPGDDMEAVVALTADGDFRLIARIKGTELLDGVVTASNIGLPTSWGSNHFQLSARPDNSLHGRDHHVRHLAVDPSAMDTNPETGTAEDVMNELAAVRLDRSGNLL